MLGTYCIPRAHFTLRFHVSDCGIETYYLDPPRPDWQGRKDEIIPVEWAAGEWRERRD